MADDVTMKFQFHKGTIKSFQRLPYDLALTQFQFHKGTIKSTDCRGVTSIVSPFQFHKGTIKSKTINPVGERFTIVSIPQGYD